MTTISSFRSEATARSTRMLRTALGPLIAAHLEDLGVVEIMLNPDGRLWIDRLSGGLEDTGSRIAPADAERIVRLVAHHVGAEVHTPACLLACRQSCRKAASASKWLVLLPVVAAPCFAIRRPAIAVFSLDDYVKSGIMARQQASVLRTRPFGIARTSWLLGVRRPARQRWSTPSWRRSRRPATGWC